MTTNNTSSKLLKISSLRMGGGKITFLLLRTPLLLILLIAFLEGYHAGKPHGEVSPVRITNKAAYFDADSIDFYARRAYLDDDPDALFFMASAAYLKDGGYLPDSIPTVPLDEADMMCYRAAQQGHSDAQQVIRFFLSNDEWYLHLPLDFLDE